MKTSAILAALALASLLAGCTEDQTPRSYVQANAVQKSLFAGEWYFRSCVIKVNYEAGQFTFPGDCSADYLNSGGGYVSPRIRWLIDQNYLYAIRTYEFIEDGNPVRDGEPAGAILGEPLAAFAIQSHFDIRRDYNPVTGEEVNVLVENTSDRLWAEREYMRVDWSMNLITTPELNMASLYDLFGLYTREPASFYVQTDSAVAGYEWPAEWRPRFLRTNAEEDAYDTVNRVEEYGGEDVFYYMDFVTQEIFTPGMADNPYTGQMEPWCMSQVYVDAPLCTSALITIRNAFLKVPTNHQYEPTNWVDSRHENFGYWRMDRQVYDPSSDTDPTDPQYGRTDFMNYNLGRFNIWQRVAEADGTPIPLPEREVRRTVFYTTSEMPYHLLRPSVELVAEWNRHYMKAIRVARNQPLPSWEGHAEWIFDPGTGDAYTCAGGPNIFGSCPPAERTYAGEPYACRIGIDSRDSGTGVPATLAPDLEYDITVKLDTDFANDRFMAMEGDECVLVGRVNSCVRHPAGRDGEQDPGLPCEERGDLRYSFVAYCDQPGTDFLGIAQMRSDPITGEFIGGDANIGGPALDGYRTTALIDWDMQTGELTEEEYIMGEHAREYLANVWGSVDRPAVPQRENLEGLESLHLAGLRPTEMRSNMDRAMVRAAQLKGDRGRTNIMSHRIRQLAGTDLERVLFDNDEAMAVAGLYSMDPGASTSQTRLDLGSLFRTSLPQRLEQIRHFENKLSIGCLMRPNVWIDHSVAGFVNRIREEFPGIDTEEGRPWLGFLVNRHLYWETALHEFGHVLGLRHQFHGNTDSHNFAPEYYPIMDANPMPDPDTFDENGDGRLDTLESAALGQAQRDVYTARELANVKTYMTSSLMEYTGQWYERIARLGPYDGAAVLYGYADVVEVWENGSGDPADIRPDRTPLTHWKYYHGGETCETDADCPFASGGPRYAELLPAQTGFGAVQRCDTVSTSYAGPVRACSNFWTDMARLNAAGNDEFVARRYDFCSDERTGDLADCSRFDEGASYREIVQNLRDSFNRRYLSMAFRRYRSSFDFYPYLSSFMRYYETALKIFQDMFRRYAVNEDNYRDDTGPFGFYDQYMASVDILNWFVETLALPNVGSYDYKPYLNRYAYASRFMDATATELNIPMGVGKYTYSIYQGGLEGINRLERIGTLYDKIWTLQMMLMRDWGFAYTIDEPYFVNMYDLFPNELMRLLTGLIADEPGYYMPRVMSTGTGGTETRIIYPNVWMGPCRVDEGEDCWAADTSLDALIPLESASFYVQMLGISYALAEVPTFFDPAFQEQAQVYVVGYGGGANVPPGAVECPLGSDTPDCDFAVFTSARYRRQYLAFKADGNHHGHGAGSIGFAIVRKAAGLQVELQRLEQCLVDAGGEIGGPCAPTDVCDRASRNCSLAVEAFTEQIDFYRNEVSSYESFIRYLLEVLGQYGINTWISYRGSM